MHVSIWTLLVMRAIIYELRKSPSEATLSPQC
jgi:hypothetical protein